MLQVIEAVIAVTVIAEFSIRKTVTVSEGKKKRKPHSQAVWLADHTLTADT